MFRSPFGGSSRKLAKSPLTQLDSTREYSLQSLNSASQSLPPIPKKSTHESTMTIPIPNTNPGTGNTNKHIDSVVSVYTTTWNTSGVVKLEDPQELVLWLPRGHDIYAIAIQEVKKPEIAENTIHLFLGGPEAYFKYKSKDIAGTMLIVFVAQPLHKSGIFKQPQFNACTRHEMKGGSGSVAGRGAICMQFSFNDTTIAFVACKLDTKSFERRVADLEIIFKDIGMDGAEAQEEGQNLSKIHHVILLGDFQTRILYPPKSSIRFLVAPAPPVGSPWDHARWLNLIQLDEIGELRKKLKALRAFTEIPICYPPSAWRRTDANPIHNSGGKKGSKGNLIVTSNEDLNEEYKAATQRLAKIYESDFALEELFDLKFGGQPSAPSYTDRILYRSMKGYHHLLKPVGCGTNDAVLSSSHVPVYSVFHLNGIDLNLIYSWQRITGNLPPKQSTRIDPYFEAADVAHIQTNLKEESMMPLMSPISSAGTLNLRPLSQRGAPSESSELTSPVLENNAPSSGSATPDPSNSSGGGDKCSICNLAIGRDEDRINLPSSTGDAHAACFKCSNCEKPLLGEKYFFVDNHWLCENDYNKLYAKNCPKCKKPIAGGFLRCGDSQYHQDCFVCTKPHCNKHLYNTETGEFLEFDELESKPFCMEHYKELSATMNFCASCNRLIKSTEVGVPYVRKTPKGEETTHFHSTCFHCHVCHVNLDKSEKKFIIKDGLMYCQDDFERLFGPIPVGSHSHPSQPGTPTPSSPATT